MAFLHGFVQIPQPFQNVQLVIARFRRDDDLGSAGNRSPDRQIAAPVAHHFHDGTTMMRAGGIAQFIHRFHDGIQRRVKADRKIGARNIVVDRSRQTDTVNAQFRQRHRAAIRTVAADHDDRVDLRVLQRLHRFFLYFQVFEFR